MDTNIVSDYFSASFSVDGIALMDTIIDAVPKISVITQKSCFAGKEMLLLNKK